MPNLFSVSLPLAFNYKFDVFTAGSVLFVTLSRIDIGTLQRFFRWDEEDY